MRYGSKRIERQPVTAKRPTRIYSWSFRPLEFQVREPKQWLPTLGAKIGIAKSLSRDDVLGKVVPLGYPNHRSTFSPVEIVAQQRVVGDYPRVRP